MGLYKKIILIILLSVLLSVSVTGIEPFSRKTIALIIPGAHDNGSSTNVTSVESLHENLVTSPSIGDVKINFTLPTCSGNDKLTYNGSGFVCSTDFTSNASLLQTNVSILYGNNGSNDLVLKTTSDGVLKLDIEGVSASGSGGTSVETNISILYGVNDNNITIPLKTTAEGVLKLDIDSVSATGSGTLETNVSILYGNDGVDDKPLRTSSSGVLQLDVQSQYYSGCPEEVVSVVSNISFDPVTNFITVHKRNITMLVCDSVDYTKVINISNT